MIRKHHSYGHLKIHLNSTHSVDAIYVRTGITLIKYINHTIEFQLKRQLVMYSDYGKWEVRCYYGFDYKAVFNF